MTIGKDAENQFGIEAIRLPDRYRSLLLDWDARLAADGPLDIEVEIEIDSVQLSRVAPLLDGVDLAVRRATSFLSGSRALLPDREIRPVSSSIGGLLVVSVEIGSYKAKHKPHGQSAQFAQEHPIIIGLLTGLLVNTVFYFAPPLHQPPPPASYQERGMIIVNGGTTTIELPAKGLMIGTASRPKAKRPDDPEMIITFSLKNPTDEQVTIRVTP